MDWNLGLRVAALCLLLAAAETLHGIARTVLVVPRLGKARALALSALTGSLLAFALCWIYVPGLRLHGALAHGLLGLGLAGFMAAFDIAVGRLLMRKPLAKIWPDFDPRTGNFLAFGLLSLALAPWLVSVLRG